MVCCLNVSVFVGRRYDAEWERPLVFVRWIEDNISFFVRVIFWMFVSVEQNLIIELQFVGIHRNTSDGILALGGPFFFARL